MKKILCLWVIVLFAVSLSIGQTKGKSTVRKPVRVQKVSVAEKAWSVYLPSLKSAFSTRDYQSIRKKMTKDVRCGWVEDSNRDGDSRDECLADWKMETENNSYIHWKDISKILSGRPCKLEYERYDGHYRRRMGGESPGKICNLQGATGASFVFLNGVWFLDDMGTHEGE